jgi:cell wall-associated NlpC family hydrolase
VISGQSSAAKTPTGPPPRPNSTARSKKSAPLNRFSPAERADLGPVKDTALQAALTKRGSEYERAADGPNEFDCSGLTMWAYNAAGIKLPHSSRSQYTLGRAVSSSELRRRSHADVGVSYTAW